MSLTSDTGYFWFFDPSNVEVVIKVLNACTFNPPHYWVFAGGLTNVKVTLSVEDTLTGAFWTRTNPQSTAFQPIQDVNALSCGSTSQPATVNGVTVTIPSVWQTNVLPETPSDRAAISLVSPRGSAVAILPNGGQPYDFDPDTQITTTTLTLAGRQALRTDYSDSDGTRYLSRITFTPSLTSLPDLRIDVRWISSDSAEEQVVDNILQTLQVP